MFVRTIGFPYLFLVIVRGEFVTFKKKNLNISEGGTMAIKFLRGFVKLHFDCRPWTWLMLMLSQQ